MCNHHARLAHRSVADRHALEVLERSHLLVESNINDAKEDCKKKEHRSRFLQF